MAKKRHKNRTATLTPNPSPNNRRGGQQDDLAVRVAGEIYRQFRNTGYSNGGASRSQDYARGWNDRGGSPAEDINANLSTLIQRSRDLFMTAPLARAPINRVRTNAIGRGLRLKLTPDVEWLMEMFPTLTAEDIQRRAKQVEREFNFWAESRNCDKLRLDNFYEIQGITAATWLLCGDAFALLPMLPGRGEYETAVHLIEADRVCNPTGRQNDAKLQNGVEIASDGSVAAYWVCRAHPLSTVYGDPNRGKWDRVPVRDPATGRLNIIHMRTAERPEQYRGVPFIAGVIKRLKQAERYSQAEIDAAVAASFATVFVKSLRPDAGLGDMLSTEQKATAGAPDEDLVYEVHGADVIHMLPGEEVDMKQPGRPNTAYDGFMIAVSREIGAALDIPYEVILQSFNASYSASLAAINEAWKTFLDWRYRVIYNLCTPVLEEVCWEMVLKGFVDLPGFVDNVRARAAWLKAEWNGPAKGTIKPKEEIEADLLAAENGITTLSRISRERYGSDYDANIVQATEERRKLKEAGLQGGASKTEPSPGPSPAEPQEQEPQRVRPGVMP